VDDLPMLFNTSAVHVTTLPDDKAAPIITVQAANGDKCPRCWRVVREIVPDGDLAGVCLRCAGALGGASVAR
jgi:hypothetical protein